ncbi:hypothetical protein NIGALANA_144 [Bacillus phage Nigalana]|uniref:Uncharacterized protein n=6 Tax=Wphvirus TaxID=1922327 RepID=A0A222Z2Y0_9CAUD|nr:hypothetical protein FP72_gp137 [Bacillus phage Hakuna]YP_009212083.1 hypothetical protein QLX47_gp143 [Bacillus phage Eyuki]YP_009279310.1 hypothetical protein BIZ89_gp143 [Bacillus phage Kida]YP_009280945.1 hypothetical protein SAGEFAYGE_142 [Bacillus phage SageFayge]YP_009282536.1 hypothetical protein BI005_gp144 [Bacillus phage Nigalana]YP_009284468.1 hypothetical protein BI004_gp140 [Bacillus phage NotTheCreek]YP_009285087.1 hypothetical protein BIZ88_gp145 [Bacillus phage DirtyBetty]
MAKVHKVLMYVTDYEEFSAEQVAQEIKRTLQRSEFSVLIERHEESPPFEWDDDLKINYADETAEDYENIMKGRPEYDRT